MFKKLLLATGVAALASSTASAATITFDETAVSGNPIFTTFNSGGFTFTGAHFHIVSDTSFGLVANGTQYLLGEAAGNLGKPVDFAATSGGVFSLNSADIAEAWVPGNVNSSFLSVVFTGSVFGGGTLTQTFTLDGIRDGPGGVADFQTVNFTGWNNLTTVNVRGVLASGGFGDYSIDNLVVNATVGAIPEPATWAMMLAGFGIVGGAMRRRQRVAVSFA